MYPHLAQELGVATIYQEFNLFPTLSVAENIYMGDERISNNSPRLYRKNDYIKRAKAVLESMDLSIAPNENIENMTANMQLVEIPKSVTKNAKILIMDEPTAPLSNKETDELFKLIGRLKQKGVAIIYISHRMDEIFKIADRVTIMRDGRKIQTSDIGELTHHKIIQLMANREIEEIEFNSPARKEEVVLEVKELCGNGLENISFSIHKGEVFGLGGLLGAGRTELARLIFGADPIKSGHIYINGKEISIKNPKQAVDAGIAYVPEDRKHHGVILTLPIKWNISLPILKRISNAGFVNLGAENELVTASKEKLLIKTATLK